MATVSSASMALRWVVCSEGWRVLNLLKQMWVTTFHLKAIHYLCFSGRRGVHQDQLLPLFPLPLPGPLRLPFRAGAASEGEGVRGGQDSWEAAASGISSSADHSVSESQTLTSSVLFQELSVVCPVCREPLDYDLDQLLASPAPQLPEVNIPPSITSPSVPV